MRHFSSCTSLLIAVSTVASAQVTLTPGRISRDFRGQVPLIWTVEGEGTLQSASLRILDESGKERVATKSLAVRNLGGGQWQVSELVAPTEVFESLEVGRYVGEWRLEWLRKGVPRQERVESALRLGGRGDGWLQRAFQDAELRGLRIDAPTSWPEGADLPLKVSFAKGTAKVRYQVVDDGQEQVLRPWTDLPAPKGGLSRLAWDPKWKLGLAHLWILVEDERGNVSARSLDLQLGLGGAQGRPTRQPPRRTSAAKTATSQRLQAAAPSLVLSPALSWLSAFDPSQETVSWDQTNRVATVAAGYLDQERNADQLWPSDANRPLSLSLTGANKLGKPLYSVSYLLDSDVHAAKDLAELAQEAVGSVGNGSLPAGATALKVGGIKAPVVFSGGTVEDFLGKPLASGFGWAKTTPNAQGNLEIVTAAAWAADSKSAPEVGLSAIQNGAAFKAQLIKDAVDVVGYTNAAEPVLLDDTRLPHTLNFTTQDPSGRVVLSKGIGSVKSADPAFAPQALGKVVAEDISLSCSFENGDVPVWLGMGSTTTIDTPQGTSYQAVLPAPYKSTVTHGGGCDDQGCDLWTSEEVRPGGSLIVNLRGMVPGIRYTVACTTRGKLNAYLRYKGGRIPVATWTQDGDQSVQVSTENYSGYLPTGESQPYEGTLVIENAGPVTQNTPDPGATAFVSRVQVTASLTLGLVADAGTLASNDRIPGFTRSQFGTVVLEGVGTCTVSMVTDPDGSAVAEVKDPEGRTIYKIVNPSATYTNLFLDHEGYAFRPASPRSRGQNAGTDVGANQRDLVTQYVFDTQGHLRVVIPPLGFSGTWGFNLSDSDMDRVLSQNAAIAPTAATVANNPIPYATYNAYDDSGHLVATHNPDEGLAVFKVDQKGRVQFSQTTSQRARGSWTRTLYDQIFRVRAVGEVDGSDMDFSAAGIEAPTIVTDDRLTDFAGTTYKLKRAVSVNLYDDYQGVDPLVDTVLDARLRDLLPAKVLWGAFADGHLTQTLDANTIERYFYDQDGRIVIRWVSLKGSSGTWRHFATGIFYDFAGRVKRLVYPAGPGGDPLQVVYTYDDLGRLFAVGTPADASYFARYAYHPTGELRAIVYGPGEGFAVKRMLQDPQGWLRTLTVQGR